MSTETWLITGASRGLGYALAEEVLARGHRAVLGARSTGTMHELASRYADRTRVVELDVADPGQRAKALRVAEEEFGGVSVLVNNAGIDYVGAIEEQLESDYRRIFEINFFAPVALLREALPGMRTRRRGTIVNISSMDGIASLPANGFYSASKFALEGLTEALWQEIEPLGLRAMLVELGSFRTGIEARTALSGDPIDDYEATAGAFRSVLATLTPEMFPGDPARAATAIVDDVEQHSMRHWLILGSDAHRRIGVKLDQMRSEYDAIAELAGRTDYPDNTIAPVL